MNSNTSRHYKKHGTAENTYDVVRSATGDKLKSAPRQQSACLHATLPTSLGITPTDHNEQTDTHSTCTPSNIFKTTLFRPVQINDVVFLYIRSRPKRIADTPTHQSVCLLSLPSITQPTRAFPSLFTRSRHTNMCMLRHRIPPTPRNCILYSRLNPR